MSYTDPYYSHTNETNNNDQSYRDRPEFDPYYLPQTQGAYDQSGYVADVPYARAEQNIGERGGSRLAKERSQPSAADFNAASGGFKSPDGFRTWRRNHYKKLWTKGSRVGCVARFCCCTILIALFLIVGIVLTLAVYLRPPTIAIGDVALPTNGSTVQVETNSLNVNMSVNISVANPNYLKITASSIKADFTYPINNTDVGGGELDNVVFHAHSETDFTFPFTISYVPADDPNQLVLEDLITKCAILGGTPQDITVNYDITVALKILSVTIHPSFSSSLSFACPFTVADLESILGGTLNVTGLL